MSYLVQDKIAKEELENIEDRLRSILPSNVAIHHMNDGLGCGQQADKVIGASYPIESIELAVSDALNLSHWVGKFDGSFMKYPIFHHNRGRRYFGFSEGKLILTHFLSYFDGKVRNVGKTKGSLLQSTKTYIATGSKIREEMDTLRQVGVSPHYGAEYVQAIDHISNGRVAVNFIVLLGDFYHPNPRLYISRLIPSHTEIRPDMFDKNGKQISEYGLRFSAPLGDKNGVRVSLNPKEFFKNSSHIATAELPKVSIEFNKNQFDDECVENIEDELAMRKQRRKSWLKNNNF